MPDQEIQKQTFTVSPSASKEQPAHERASDGMPKSPRDRREEKPTFNLEAERWVLGACLLQPELVEAAASIVAVNDFSQAHRPIYLRLLGLFQTGQSVDALLVINDLRQHGELDSVGGPAYVCGLTDGMARGSNIRAYCELVREAAVRRCTIEAIKSAVNSAAAGNGEIMGIVAHLRAELDTLADLEPGSCGGWPEPKELPPLLPEAPTMMAEYIPEPSREWLVDISQRKQIPLEIPAAAAIVEAGAVVGRKLAILPKRHDDWLVVPNLWGMIVARSGMMKTPTIQEALKPLGRLAVEAHTAYEQAHAENSAAEQVHGAKLEAVRAEIKKAAKAEDANRLAQLSAELAQLEDQGKDFGAKEKRLRVNDATVEKLCELLRDNPNGLLLFRDELSGWLRSLDKTGREGDREFFLESWDGTNSFTQDRIGRGTIHVPFNCLSVLGGIQPGKLTSYVDDAVAGKTGDDGLLQRFQVTVYPERRRDWQNVDTYPKHDARERAFRVFQNLNHLDPLTVGAKLPRYDKTPALNFDDDAQ